MKRALFLILVAACLLTVAVSARVEKKTPSNILIVYFAVAENSDVDAISTASVYAEDGNPRGFTRVLADMIQERTGGDLFSLQTSVDYPGQYPPLADYAQAEQQNGVLPELTSTIENLDQYDTIFVGYPIWWYGLPQIMRSFFETYDLSGKTVIPFCTHLGSRFSGTIEDIKELEPEANVIDNGFTVQFDGAPTAGEDVAAWLTELGY